MNNEEVRNPILVSWVPTLSLSIVFDSIVTHPKGDRSPKNVTKIGTCKVEEGECNEDDGMVIKSTRVSNDQPVTDLFQLADCETLYESGSYSMLQDSLLCYGIKTSKKYLVDSVSGEKALREWCKLGKKKSESEYSFNCLKKEGGLLSNKVSEQSFLQLEICHAAWGDETDNKTGMDAVDDFCKTKGKYKPLANSHRSLKRVYGLLFSNGLVLLKVDPEEFEDEYNRIKKNRIELKALTEKQDENKKKALEEEINRIESLLEGYRFEAYSFIKDCWHDHKFHSDRADGIVRSKEVVSVTNEACKGALTLVLNNFYERCLEVQRISGTLGDEKPPETLLQVKGFLLYTDALHKLVYGERNNNRQIKGEHLDIRIQDLLSQIDTANNNQLTLYGLVIAVMLFLMQFINDVYQSGGKLPSIRYLDHLVFDSAEYNLMFFWACVSVGILVVLYRPFMRGYSNAIRQSEKRNIKYLVYQSLHDVEFQYLKKRWLKSRHLNFPEKKFILLKDWLFKLIHFMLTCRQLLSFLGIALLARVLIDIISNLLSCFSFFCKDKQNSTSSEKVKALQANQPILYAVKDVIYEVMELERGKALRAKKENGESILVCDWCDVTSLLACFLLLPLYILRNMFWRKKSRLLLLVLVGVLLYY